MRFIIWKSKSLSRKYIWKSKINNTLFDRNKNNTFIIKKSIKALFCYNVPGRVRNFSFYTIFLEKFITMKIHDKVKVKWKSSSQNNLNINKQKKN